MMIDTPRRGHAPRAPILDVPDEATSLVANLLRAIAAGGIVRLGGKALDFGGLATRLDPEGTAGAVYAAILHGINTNAGIAAAVNITPATVSHHIDRLAAAGLVCRRASLQDARRTSYEPTPLARLVNQAE